MFKAPLQTPITLSAMEKKTPKSKNPLLRILPGLLIPIDVLREHCSDAHSLDTRTDGFNSPVPHLFTSNAPPSKEEKLRIQEVLVAARKSEVAAPLEFKRSEMDNRLQDGLSEKQRFIHDHEQLLSSLRTFPPELLECIFKFCLFDSEGWPLRDRRRPASFSLSHVCKRWRDVALNVPYLLPYLPRIKLSTGGTTTMGLDLLEAVLLRSKDEDLWCTLNWPVITTLTTVNLQRLRSWCDMRIGCVDYLFNQALLS